MRGVEDHFSGLNDPVLVFDSVYPLDIAPLTSCWNLAQFVRYK